MFFTLKIIFKKIKSFETFKNLKRLRISLLSVYFLSSFMYIYNFDMLYSFTKHNWACNMPEYNKDTGNSDIIKTGSIFKE